MMCALLHQIFLQDRKLLRIAAKHCHGRHIPHIVKDGETQTLWKIFLEIATSPSPVQIFCIVDGMDECEPQSRQHLVRSLDNLFSQKSRNRRIRVLISMRPDSDVTKRFENVATIRYDESNGLHEDVQRMIVQKVDSMKFPVAHATMIEQQISAKAGKTFLWASSVLSTISNQDSLRRSDIQHLIDSKKLADTYDHALRHSTDSERAFGC